MAVFIHPSAEVHPSAVIGDGTKIWNGAQIREGAVIGRNCVISKDVYVDAGVRIGDGCKIQNGVSVYKGVEVEDEVFIGPFAVFTNDLYPRAAVKEWKVIPTRLQRGCSIGANATVIPGITIGSYAMLAAGSVVTTDVPRYTLVAGNPARPVGCVCHCGRRMTRLGIIADKTVFQCPACESKLTSTAQMFPLDRELVGDADFDDERSAAA